MSTTTMLTTNANTRKLWAKKGFIDMYKRTWFGHLSTRGTIHNDATLSRMERGDNITYNFTGILTGTGLTEGGILDGNAEALNNFADSISINVTRHGVQSPGMNTIEQQRTIIDFHERAKKLLPKWQASRLDASVFNQLAGVNANTIITDGTPYSGADRVIVQGHNPIVAPSANRVIRPGAAANDESLGAADVFTLDLVDAAIERVRSSQPTIELLDNDEMDLYISPEQETDLKRDTTGKIQWFTINTNVIAGGDTVDNKLMNGSMFGKLPIAKYANVWIYSCDRVANGVDSGTNDRLPNVRRAVMCGRNALVFASPMGGSLNDDQVPLVFEEELSDFNYQRAIEARMIYGLKKLVFDSEDYGNVVIPTFAAPHTS